MVAAHRYHAAHGLQMSAMKHHIMGNKNFPPVFKGRFFHAQLSQKELLKQFPTITVHRLLTYVQLAYS